MSLEEPDMVTAVESITSTCRPRLQPIPMSPGSGRLCPA